MQNDASSSPSTHNPVLDLASPIDFARIRAEHVVPGLRELIEDAGAKLDALASDRGSRTFDNTLGALERVTERLELAMEVVEHLEAVATTPALRAAYNSVQPEVSAFFSRIGLSEGVWRALREFAATDEAKGLTGARKRLLDKTLADFRRSGADLGPEAKKRYEAIDVELAQLTLRFGQNVLDATNVFELVVEDPARLAGLPASAVAAARESAAAKGLSGYRFTLQAPSYQPAMTYLDDAALRERLYRASGARASSGATDNAPLVRRILELRREKARLLGYANFADLVCEDRMAKTGDAARQFIRDLRARTEPFFVKENEELLAFRRELEGPSAPPLEPWDVAYYAEKLRRARYDFDEEALRPYFALDRVLEGVFALAKRLYGVTVEPWPAASTWDPSVLPHLLREPNGEVGAEFYVDVFPRENKRDGAWMHGLISALGEGEGRGRHVEILAGNFTPPVGGGTALLRHREVETLFHEFGHLMHHASSRVPFRSLAGTSVARDFVELPSQIMENWCWEQEALALFARHHETGAPLPADQFERMLAARNFRAANARMRQLGFAELDLALHIDFDPAKDGDVVAYGRAILERHAPTALPTDHAMVCSFGHLFASPVGYAAGYYSYGWAQVLDADAFSRFKAEGLFNRTVGESFRREILSRGNSEDPGELFQRFMGRPPTLDALLEREGLKRPASP